MSKEFQDQINNLKSINLKSIDLIQEPYQQLIHLLEDERHTRSMFRLISIFELTLKMHVLINLSLYLNDQEKFKDLSPAYAKLLGQNSFGNWKSIGDDIIDIIPNPEANNIHINALKNIITPLNGASNIINWRNNSIAHGGMLSVENETEHLIRFIDQLCKLYNQNLTYYNSLTYTHQKNEVVFHFDGDKSIKMSPFIQRYNNLLYCYEKYIAKDNKHQTEYLEYVKTYNKDQRRKEYQNIIYKIYMQVKNLITLQRAEDSAEEKYYSDSAENTITDILTAKNFAQFTFLRDDILSSIKSNKRILLQMDAGMGKTTFIRQMDSLINGSLLNKEHNKIMSRAFYCNSVYSYSPDTFFTKLRDILREFKGEMVNGSLPPLNLQTAPQDIANFMNEMFKYHKKKHGIEHLLLFIDGIDELSSAKDDNFLSLLPDHTLLDDGISLIFTCRPTDNTSPYIQEILAQLNIQHTISLDPSNQQYNNLLVSYIKNNTKQKGQDSQFVKEICEIAEYKFLSLNLYMKAYTELKHEELSTLPTGTVEKYLYVLHHLYGEGYASEIINLALYLCLLPFPISMKRLVRIIGQDEVTFKVLCYFHELTPFISISRENYGNVFSITREEVRNYLLEKHKDKISQISEDIHAILNQIDKENELSENELLTLFSQFSLYLHHGKATLGSDIEQGIVNLYYNFCADTTSSESIPLIKSIFIICASPTQGVLKKIHIFTVLNIMYYSSPTLSNYGFAHLIIELTNKMLVILLGNKQLMKSDDSPCISLMESLALAYGALGMHKDVQETTRLIAEFKSKYSSDKSQKSIPSHIIIEAMSLKNQGEYQKGIDLLDLYIQKYIDADVKKIDIYMLPNIIHLFLVYANCLKRTPRIQESFKYFDKCKEILDVLEKSDPNNALGIRVNLYLDMGSAIRVFNPEQAYQIYLEGVELSEQADQRGEGAIIEKYIPNLYSNMAILLDEQGDQFSRWPKEKSYEVAKEYAFKGLDFYDKMEELGRSFDRVRYAKIYLILGDIFLKLDDSENVNFYKKELDNYCKEHNIDLSRFQRGEQYEI